MTTLVTYASRHGATQGIATRIARHLAGAGVDVDLRHVDQVETLDEYDAVVFGAPVYDQNWPPEANHFAAEFREDLSQRPLWLFSVGSFGDTKRLIGWLMPREPKEIAEIRADLKPREYRVFQGVIQKEQWPFLSRMFFRVLGGRFGDHRDWPSIDAWAEQIATASTDGRAAARV